MTDIDKNPPAEAPAVVLHGNRSRVVPLEYPAEFQGVTYTQVTLRRPTRAEVARFVDAVGTDDEHRLPIYDVPDDVIEALDPDDYAAVDGATFDFLPRSLQTALKRSQSPGEATSPSPQASSAAE